MMPGAFTVDELLSAVRGLDATVGTATVYRSVAHLEESSWIERVGERAGSALFARCPAEDHHHHLVCTSCGKIAPAACPLEGDLTKTAERAGFLVTEHHVTLYGLCSSCRIDSGGAS
jgi:Fur family ferric uptake transcriptional regulator